MHLKRGRGGPAMVTCQLLNEYFYSGVDNDEYKILSLISTVRLFLSRGEDMRYIA